MIALVIGATGSTGAHLVNYLINESYFTDIKLFVRKPISFNSEKVQVFVVDFERISDFSDDIRGDVFFSCLGSTLKEAGSKEDQWEIDFNIPFDFAKIASANEVDTCVLVSSLGASSNSVFFYSRLKGSLEDALDTLAFKNFIVFRPGILDRKNSDRLGEKLAVKFLYFLNFFGFFKMYQPVPTSTLAKKLVKASKTERGKVILELDKINAY